MNILAWNVGPRFWRKILRAFRALSRDHPAKITALFEASNPLLVQALRVLYPHKRVICQRTDVVAIISRDAPSPRVEVIGHDVAWTGPHLGLPKHGRRWLLLVWEDEAVLLIHRVTPLGNEVAWNVETELIAAVCSRLDLPDRLAVIGDHNGTRDRLERDYEAMGLDLLPVNAKVDQCAVRKFRGRGRRLGNHGSDHVAIGWRLRDAA